MQGHFCFSESRGLHEMLFGRNTNVIVWTEGLSQDSWPWCMRQSFACDCLRKFNLVVTCHSCPVSWADRIWESQPPFGEMGSQLAGFALPTCSCSIKSIYFVSQRISHAPPAPPSGLKLSLIPSLFSFILYLFRSFQITVIALLSPPLLMKLND